MALPITLTWTRHIAGSHPISEAICVVAEGRTAHLIDFYYNVVI